MTGTNKEKLQMRQKMISTDGVQTKDTIDGVLRFGGHVFPLEELWIGYGNCL